MYLNVFVHNLFLQAMGALDAFAVEVLYLSDAEKKKKVHSLEHHRIKINSLHTCRESARARASKRERTERGSFSDS
jgi:hypothetical protein